MVYTNPVTGIDGAPTTTIRLNHFAYDQQGEEDYLYMIPVDLNGMASPALQFAYTHASYPGYFDGLRVDVFADCDLGGTPVNVWEQNDPDFAITSTNSSYSPSASSDWRQAFISLDQFAGQKIVVRFASLNGYGNNT